MGAPRRSPRFCGVVSELEKTPKSPDANPGAENDKGSLFAILNGTFGSSSGQTPVLLVHGAFAGGGFGHKTFGEGRSEE